MWTREQLKSNAKIVFSRNYWACVAVALLMGIFAAGGGTSAGVNSSSSFTQTESSYYDDSSADGYYADSHIVTREMAPLRAVLTSAFVVVVLLAMAAGFLLSIFVGNVFEVGGCNFFIKNRVERAHIGEVLSGFKSGHYLNVVLIMFLRNLFTFLWSLLLIVPGIVKSYEYYMVPYIVAENPGMNHTEAFAISKRMMDGEKWNAFVLDLSFIGWELLSSFTCGILGVFYVNPYIQATKTELYSFNKIKAYNQGYIR